MTSIITAGRAFDQIANSYDELFTNSVIGRAQRDVVWRALARNVRRGDRVLDMNCGTGEDALYLLNLGARVVAFDASSSMIEVARSKTSSQALAIDYLVGDIEHVDSLVEGRFDVILSNFSGMNCISDLSGVAQKLCSITRSSGTLYLCVSTRVCLWESLFYLLRGDVRRATRRWSGFSRPSVGGHEVPVWYPKIGQLRSALHPYFELHGIQAVGFAVPPSYLESWARRHPRLLDFMERFDRLVSRLPLCRMLGDHVLLEFRRSDA